MARGSPLAVWHLTSRRGTQVGSSKRLESLEFVCLPEIMRDATNQIGIVPEHLFYVSLAMNLKPLPRQR